MTFRTPDAVYRQPLTELESQKINADTRSEKTKNELLQEGLEANQREPASTTLHMVQKNELLARLKMQLMKLNSLYPNNRQKERKRIESSLQSNLYMDMDWGNLMCILNRYILIFRKPVRWTSVSDKI